VRRPPAALVAFALALVAAALAGGGAFARAGKPMAVPIALAVIADEPDLAQAKRLAQFAARESPQAVFFIGAQPPDVGGAQLYAVAGEHDGEDHLGRGVDVGANVHVSLLAGAKAMQLKWLELDLQANAGKFLFVIARDAPAASERAALWKILKQHKVAAYVHARGVESAGAAVTAATGYRFLIITVPPIRDAAPHVDARGADNQQLAAFELKPRK